MHVLPQLTRNRFVLLADFAAIALAAWMAFALRFGWLFLGTRPEFPVFVIGAIVLKVAVFSSFGLYRRYWRYAGFWDLLAVVLANSVGSLLLSILMVGLRLMDLIPGLSRSVLPLDGLFALALTTGVRAGVRILAESTAPRQAVTGKPNRRVLIAGAGDAGVLVAREMQKNPQVRMTPVAFIDDDPAKLNKSIYGVPVLGNLSDLSEVVQSRAV